MAKKRRLTSIHIISGNSKDTLILWADEAATAQYLAGTINDDTRFTAFCIPTANMSTDSMTILMEDGVVRKVISSSEN